MLELTPLTRADPRFLGNSGRKEPGHRNMPLFSHLAGIGEERFRYSQGIMVITSELELDESAWRLNTRPGKSPGWKCPAERFRPEGAFDFKSCWAKESNLVALRD